MPHTNITLSAARRAGLALVALLPTAGVAADLAAQAATLTADAPHGMVLYLKHCASCHGRRAWGNGLQEVPSLAGQRETYLIAQLANFINSNRHGSELHGPVMHDTLQPPGTAPRRCATSVPGSRVPRRTASPSTVRARRSQPVNGPTSTPVRAVTGQVARGATSRRYRQSPANTTPTCSCNCEASPRAHVRTPRASMPGSL